MTTYRIASDEMHMVHVLASPHGDQVSLCGWGTAPHSYTVNGHVTEVTRLLIETIGGCRKCADLLMASRYMKVGVDRRYAEQHTKEKRT